MASPSAKQVEEVASPSFASPNDTSNKNLTVEITAEIMEVTEGHTTNDLEDNMSTNNADAKREVFSSSLKSYLPIPTRVLAGDFELKVQRDRTLSDAIQVAVANTSLATEKIQQLKQEALRYAIKKFVSKERSKMNMEEKKRQRMQKKDELLKSIFSAAIEREQEEALRRDVKRVIDKMLRACELQLNATAVKNNNSSSSSSILPTKPPTVAGKAIPVPPAAMETEKTNIVEVKVESVIYTPISAIPPPLPITMEIVTTTEVKEIATLTVKEE